MINCHGHPHSNISPFQWHIFQLRKLNGKKNQNQKDQPEPNMRSSWTEFNYFIMIFLTINSINQCKFLSRRMWAKYKNKSSKKKNLTIIFFWDDGQQEIMKHGKLILLKIWFHIENKKDFNSIKFWIIWATTSQIEYWKKLCNKIDLINFDDTQPRSNFYFYRCSHGTHKKIEKRIHFFLKKTILDPTPSNGFE